nr:hypothetical protein CFP56_08198 [Quercus suber]
MIVLNLNLFRELLRDYADACTVLTANTGTNKIRGLMLYSPKHIGEGTKSGLSIAESDWRYSRAFTKYGM